MPKGLRTYYTYTGGAAGSLDSMPLATFEDHDANIIHTDGEFALFHFDSSSAVGESTPWTTNGVIVPDDAAANPGEHVLQGLKVRGITTGVGDVLTLAGTSEDITIDFSSPNIAELNSSTGAILKHSLASRYSDNVYLGIGNGADAKFWYDFGTIQSLQLGLITGADATSGYFSIMEQDDMGLANREPAAATIDPTVRVWAPNAAGDTTPGTNYGELYHDQTDFNIVTGGGEINISGGNINIDDGEGITTNGRNLIRELLTEESIYIGTDGGNTATGIRAIALGYQAGRFITGDQNTFIGYRSGYGSVSGDDNFGLGTESLRSLTSGSDNVAVGTTALRSIKTAVSNVAIGENAMRFAVGGNYNTAIGRRAGYGVASSTITANTLLGAETGYDLDTDGDYNVFVGYRSGFSVTTGANNLFLGALTGGVLTTGDNNILIGYDIDAQSATGSNQMSIGNIIFATGVDGTGTTVSNANVGIGETSPVCNLDIDGGIAMATVAKTGAYTTTVNDHTITCGAGNETFTVTLIAAASATGQILNIKNVGTGTITVDGNGAETIDGAATQVIATQYDCITIQSDATSWHII